MMQASDMYNTCNEMQHVNARNYAGQAAPVEPL